MQNKSICTIFQSMADFSDSEKDNTVSSEVSEWLKDYSGKEEKYRYMRCCAPPSIGKNLQIESIDWKFKLMKIELRQDFLAKLLNRTSPFNLNDSKELVAVIYKDLNHYLNSAEDSIFNNKDGQAANLHITIRDLYIFGRLFAPLLIAGYSIHVYPEASLQPFLVAFGDLTTEIGIPEGTKFALRVVGDNCLKIPDFDISADMNDIFGPMLIFEDSDTHSALDCLINSAHRFSGMLYWSVSHVYVQESIFHSICCELRYITKRVDWIQLLEGLEQLETSCTSGGTKFCIDWDPKELGIKVDSTIVSVLPFRTVDEVVTLVNAHNTGCAVSLWTEKLSVANYISKFLKIGTIWVNSHGVLDPMVPLDSWNESHLPLNGPQLVEQIANFKKCTLVFVDSALSSSSSETRYFRGTVEEAVELSLKGYKNLKTKSDEEIECAMKMLNLVESKKMSEFKNLFKSGVIYRSDTKMNVLSFSYPYRNVMVIFRSLEVHLNVIFEILSFSIKTRNALIICAPSPLLTKFACSLPFCLPEGSVTLLDLKNFDKLNAHKKRIGRIFTYPSLNGNLETSSSVSSAFLGRKSIWMPLY